MTCVECGKTKNLNQGIMTTWAGKYSEPRFLCNECANRLEKAEEEKKLRKILDIAEEVKKLKIPDVDITQKTSKGYATEVVETMLEVLRAEYKEDGYYKISTIAEKFKRMFSLKTISSRRAGHILSTLGFTSRKHKNDGDYVYVSKLILEKYTKYSHLGQFRT